ncbi:MAG: hypothetical protein GKR98_00480 [Boseongicola sp.]|nr:MAG: hypothetical protein GKR98_00480 [Boseongicola sp.]
MSRNDSEIVLKSSEHAHQARVFSVHELTLRTGEGVVVPLRRQSAQVLTALIAADGKILSKDALIAEVWGKSAVTDDSLTQCISDIRKALDDDDHLLLQTHARKGYALMRADGAASRNIWFSKRGLASVFGVAGVALLLAVSLWPDRDSSEKPAIAVLAFEDFSPAPDQGYLSDAVAEGIITELARFAPFSTIARNSSFSFRGKALSIEEIGEALKADYVLEGSQQKLNEKLIITVQLIDASNGRHIWAESYDGSVSQLFEFQAEIIRRVASTVGGQLAVYPNPTGTRETITAMHLAAKGLQHQRKSGPENNRKSQSYFEAAIKADANSSKGYLGMGFYYRNMAWYAETETERNAMRGNAVAMLERALELDPENYLTHYLMGHLHADAGDLDLARARYDKTKLLNPSFSNAFVGSSPPLIYRGDLDAAIADIQHGMAIDPLHPEWFHRYLAWAYWSAGDCGAAKSALDQLSRPSPNALKTKAAVQVCLGETADSRVTAQALLEREPNLTISMERDNFDGLWTDPGKLEAWLDALRLAGLPE